MYVLSKDNPSLLPLSHLMKKKHRGNVSFSCKWLYQWRRDFFSDGYPIEAFLSFFFFFFLSSVTYLWERKDFPSAAPDGTLYAARNAIKLFHSPHITHSAPPCAPAHATLAASYFALGILLLLWRQWLPPSTGNPKKIDFEGKEFHLIHNVIYFSENRKWIRQD